MTESTLSSGVESPLPAFIDRAWLQAAFDESGVAGEAVLLEATFVGWIGTGQLARSGRIALHWDDPSGRPASVVVKVPSADPGVAEYGFELGGYQNELRFYDDVATSVACRVPVCHRTEYRPADREFALLMEDLAASIQGDQFDGLDDDRLDLALAEATRLHAPRFGDPLLPASLGQTEAPADAIETFAQSVQAAYAVAVPILIDRLGSQLEDEVVAVFNDVVPHVARWAALVSAPETAMHGDLRADNLLFGEGPGAPPIVIVDWQTVRPGSAGADVAYLIAGSIPDPRVRAERERDHVASYLRRMALAGVSLDENEFWRSYRVGSIWGLVITAIATMSAAQTERGDALFTVMAQRHGWQAIHLDAVPLIS